MIQRFLSNSENILKTVKWIVCLAFLASVLIAPRLWLLNGRTFPTCPVIPGFEVNSVIDAVLVSIMVLSLLITLFLKKSSIPICLTLILTGILILLDINRLQPEFFVFLIFLLLLLFYYSNTIAKQDAVTACKFIVCGIYFWSGIHKLNSHYYNDVYLWFMQVYFTKIPEGILGELIRVIGYISPWIEILTPLALLFLPYKKIYVGVIVLLHSFILISLSLHNFNFIVYPWNILMALLVIVLFWFNPNKSIGHKHHENLINHSFLMKFGCQYFTKYFIEKSRFNESEKVYWTRSLHVSAFIILVWVLPVLNLFGVYDSYLSFDVYSGKYPEGLIFMRETMIKNLPEKILSNVIISGKGQYYIKLKMWVWKDLKVPVYPAERVFKRYQKYIIKYSNDPSDVGCVMYKMGEYVEVK